jgi:3,4-dihydroxyphenylacetate 2,3-dioxygenase
MGEVVGAGLLAHVPTIMLPRQDRLDLNEGKEISLVPGLERLRAEVFEVLDYDTVVVFDSHWFTTVEFVVSAHDVRAGLFTSDELPRGMCRSRTTGGATPSWRMRWQHSAKSTAPG